jgi:hypothetical protein
MLLQEGGSIKTHAPLLVRTRRRRQVRLNDHSQSGHVVVFDNRWQVVLQIQVIPM